MCVKTDFFGFINMEIKIRIFGCLFKVAVREEIKIQSTTFVEEDQQSCPIVRRPIGEESSSSGENKLLSDAGLEVSSSGGGGRFVFGEEDKCREEDVVPALESTPLVLRRVDDMDPGQRRISP